MKPLSAGSSRAPSLKKLQEFIVRPGIEKHLVPLLLYRGNMALGRVQQLWNHSILMMEAESESISDGLKLHGNPAFAQLCGPHKRPQHLSMFSFFSRMKWNPKVTDNIPGLTEYVHWLMRDRGFHLKPIPLETPWKTSVSWRRQIRRRTPRETPRSSANLFYPYLIHEPAGEHELLLLVNNAVPRNIPDQFRADICQDLIVAILSGEMSKKELHGSVQTYINRVFKMFPTRYGLLSLDHPAPWAVDNRPLGDTLDSDMDHY